MLLGKKALYPDGHELADYKFDCEYSLALYIHLFIFIYLLIY